MISVHDRQTGNSGRDHGRQMEEHAKGAQPKLQGTPWKYSQFEQGGIRWQEKNFRHITYWIVRVRVTCGEEQGKQKCMNHLSHLYMI